ncbi:MAG: SusD/RagB family nutrient-binding outer membrane lipoprotein [Muribaculaceae bacterium]|nr:SusD/RagB family nutrient-binding outer membrane lipoprotein [Muribaculaceae bacterium]
MIGAGAAALCGLLACTQDFEEINTDPNKVLVGQQSPYGMFEKLLYDGATNRCYDTWYYNGDIVQYTVAISTNLRVDTYTDLNNKYFERVWNLFCNHASNAVHMYDLAEKDYDEACKAVALTLKVMNMEEVTAMFGDIPYREAFQARKTGNTQPVFDSQKEVYEQMFAELEQANEIYAKSPVFKQVSMDGMYAGDMSKWRRFNNSLYLRLLCRVSGRDRDMDGALSSKLKEIVNDPYKYPVINGNDQNATVQYTGTTPYVNYFYNYTFESYTTRYMSEEMVSLMDGGDPRIRAYFYSASGAWVGAISGALPTQDQPSGISKLCAPLLCSATFPITYIDYAEVQMILAEMALKGLIDGGESAAKEYYETALRASCERWAALLASANGWDGKTFIKARAITTEDINSFLLSPVGSWDAADNKLELIGNQKYVLLFYNGYQAFYEIQRTGYPELTIGEGTGSNNYQFPTRLAYPMSTMATNPHNAAAAIERQGWDGKNNMHGNMWYSARARNGVTYEPQIK